MIDPRTLRDEALAAFDPAMVNDEFDDDEPLEIESTMLGPHDIEHLIDVSISIDRCVLVGCDLSQVRVRGARNSLFVDCKFRGTNFRAFVRNIVFDSCQLNECVLRMMSIEDVTFASCIIASCDFYGSELTRVNFPDTNVAGVGFDRCTIESVDMTTASDLRIGDPRTLKGVSLRETQVPLVALRLAELSGIEIIEG